MTTLQDVPAGAVVVGVDGSTAALVAVDWAAEQARLEHRPLVLAHAIGLTDPAWLDHTLLDLAVAREALSRAGTAVLDEAAQLARRRHPELEVHPVLRRNDPRTLLTDLAETAGLLVLGSRGMGPVRSLLLGSVGVSVVRRSACPVVVHRPARPGLVRRGVVVGIGADAHSRSTLELAYRLASTRGLPLTVRHVVWDQQSDYPDGPHLMAGERAEAHADANRAVAEVLSGLNEKYPDVPRRVELARGRPDECLVVDSEYADLLVVGASHGHGGLALGSVAVSVVEHAACPVVVSPAGA